MISYLFCSHKYHKIENYFIFELVKKSLTQFTRNLVLFTQTNVTKLTKHGFGIRIKPIPDPRSASEIRISRKKPDSFLKSANQEFRRLLAI